jgi:hypothetical protein
MGWFYGQFIDWLTAQVQGMLAGLTTFMTATVFTNPDVTVLPQVQLLAERALLVVDAVYLLAIIAAGAVAMTHGSLQVQYQVKELLPRLVVGFVAATFGVPLCQALIAIANALTAALAGQAAPGPGAVRYVQARLMIAAADPTVALLAAVLGALIVVLFYLLLVGWFTRIAVLIVLAGIGPIALACYALPYTQPAAALWWRALAGCLVTPLLQAVFFTSGVGLLQGPVSLTGLLGSGAGAGPAVTEIVNLFIAATLLMLTVRIPKLVGRYVTQSTPAAPGAMLRTVIVSSVTRGLRLPVGR